MPARTGWMRKSSSTTDSSAAARPTIWMRSAANSSRKSAKAGTPASMPRKVQRGMPAGRRAPPADPSVNRYRQSFRLADFGLADGFFIDEPEFAIAQQAVVDRLGGDAERTRRLALVVAVISERLEQHLALDVVECHADLEAH